jgi:hypothetical protein
MQLDNLVTELDDPNLTSERREELWAESERLEDILQPSPVIEDMTADDFEKRLDERMSRRG